MLYNICKQGDLLKQANAKNSHYLTFFNYPKY